MDGFTKDLVGIITLVLGAAILGLVITHASATVSLIQGGVAGVQTLAQTIQAPASSAPSINYGSGSSIFPTIGGLPTPSIGA